MPNPNAINPVTGRRYGWEAEQRIAKGADLREVEKQLSMLERHKKALEAGNHLIPFMQFVMPDPSDPGDVEKSMYEATKLHRSVGKQVELFLKGEMQFDDGRPCVQLIFCMPPRHGKSQIATKGAAAWYSGRNPSHQVAVAAYSDTLASEFGSDTRAIINTPQYKQAFPRFKLRRGGNAKDNLETVDGGRVLFVGRGGALTGRGANCLLSGTLVMTTDGERQIEDLKVGEEVIAFENGQLVRRAIQAVARRPRSRIFRITTDAGRVVEATADHRFYVDGRWVEARELTSRDRLMCVLRIADSPAELRRGEASEARPDEVLLQQRLLGASGKHSPVRRKAVRSLRSAGAKTHRCRSVKRWAGVLLERVLARRAAGRVRGPGTRATEAVRALQRSFHAVQQRVSFLWPRLLVAGARSGDGGQGQSALDGRRIGKSCETACDAPFSRNAAACVEAGRSQVPSLHLGREVGSSPHRREPVEQSGGELGDALPTLSHEGTFYRAEADFIRTVEDTHRNADVYDIQVEGAECFFANGVLTHNCLLIDDLFKDHEEARSQTIRDQAWNWFTKVAMTRRMGKKLVMITMTRWHSDDIIGRLTDPENPNYNAIEASKWKIIRLPAIAEDDDPLGRAPGEALWPDKYDLDFLQSQQRLDPLGFAALYQQSPTVADGVLFRRETIPFYEKDQLPKDLRIYCSSDHAVGTKERNDPTVLLKIGIDSQNNIYVLDCIWRRMPSDEAVEAMLVMAGGTDKPLLWWAERGHISKSIGPFLRKRMLETGTYINLVEVTPAVDKEQRAQSIAARVAMGKVYFPKWAPWREKAISEMLAFPNGNHDDFVDALAYIGLGLQSQFGPSKITRKVPEPKFGTLDWVKQQDKWSAARRRAASHGGF